MHSSENDAFANTHMCLMMLMEPDDEVLEMRRDLGALQTTVLQLRETQVKVRFALEGSLTWRFVALSLHFF